MALPDMPPGSFKAPLTRRVTWRSVGEKAIEYALLGCALLSILTTVGIVLVLVSETIISPQQLLGWKASGAASHYSRPFFQEVSPLKFFTDTVWSPSEDPEKARFGILSLISGTFMVTGIAALVGVPVGLLTAIYLSEYASPRVRSRIKPVLEILAGVPTIVYGFFALMFITPHVVVPVMSGLLGLRVESLNTLSGGIVVGIMIIPMVASLSEDALRAVPRSLREAGYALGSTKFDVSLRIVVPAAFSGIVASFLLAVSRAVGETMAVAIACGTQPRLTLNPLVGSQTMTGFIVSMNKSEVEYGSVSYRSLYAVGLCLFVLTLLMNMISYRVMRRYREVYH
jgi:phosphate transport system permease protein